MKAPILAAILVCTPAGLAVGYVLGQRLGNHAGADQKRLREAASAAEAVWPPKPPQSSAPADVSGSPMVPAPAGFENLGLDGILAAAGPMDRFQGLMAWVQRLPKSEIEPALKKLRATSFIGMQGQFDPDRMFASHLLVARFAEADPKAAMTHLKTLDWWGQSMGIGTVLATVASKDPQAAAAFFKDETNTVLIQPQARGFIAGALAKEWMKRDPGGALTFARGLNDGGRTSALSSVIGSIAMEDPLKAAESAVGLNLAAGEDRNRVFGQVAQSWGARDPQAALAWVNSLPAGESREEATRRALDGWANTDPPAAAAHLSQRPDPAERQRLMSAITGPWARRDPAATANWISQQPEGKGREESVRNVMWMWTTTDPIAASTWLNAQPDGASKDQGIITLADQTGATDPEASLTWAATVQDPMKRQQQLEKGIEGWMKRDEAAARAWAQSSPSLTDAERVRWMGK